ncbi:MAG: cell filamentation protein Fic [Verrucomicrobia bacterium]|nr:MAG: cell filamentation protein Fic [Verrucomicrobiota bacterium]
MKKNPSRYRETGIEGEWQPGSGKRVLRNLPSIRLKTEMDRAEADALLSAEEHYLEKITPETQFTANRICQMHKDWLGEIYRWAGAYRTVEMQKGRFRWPPAFRVEANMMNLENELLKKHTPCQPDDLITVAEKVAEIHAEFLLVHPFREGNGRLARWLADLMFLQAGYPMPLYNFSGRGSVKRKADYLDAVIQGYGQNYAPLTAFFRACVDARLRELEE